MVENVSQLFEVAVLSKFIERVFQGGTSKKRITLFVVVQEALNNLVSTTKIISQGTPVGTLGQWKFTGGCVKKNRARRYVIHAFYNVNLALHNHKKNLDWGNVGTRIRLTS